MSRVTAIRGASNGPSFSILLLGWPTESSSTLCQPGQGVCEVVVRWWAVGVWPRLVAAALVAAALFLYDDTRRLGRRDVRPRKATSGLQQQSLHWVDLE